MSGLTPFTPTIQTALSYLVAARQAEADPSTAAVYLTALADLEPRLVERACRELAKEPRREFEPALPAVGTIREKVTELARADADHERAAKLLPMPSVDREPTFACGSCLDTGWRLFACQGRGGMSPLMKRGTELNPFPCARTKSHNGHTFAERCSCVPTNPVLERDRKYQRERQAAAKQDHRP